MCYSSRKGIQKATNKSQLQKKKVNINKKKEKRLQNYDKVKHWSEALGFKL